MLWVNMKIDVQYTLLLLKKSHFSIIKNHLAEKFQVHIPKNVLSF